MKRRIIHYTNRGGRYGNQLVQFAHWIAYACEHPGIEIGFWPFWSLATLARGTEENPYCIFPYDPKAPPKPRWSSALFHRLLRGSDPNRRRSSMWVLDHLLTPTIGKRHEAVLPAPARSTDDAYRFEAATIPPTVPLDDPAFERAVERLGRTIYVRGYRYRGWRLVEKHQQAVREFLAPARRFQEEARRFIDPLRKQYKTLIGVFIRHGDYRGWLGGEFFLPLERYVVLMKALREKFGPDVGFVVASDEAQDASLLAELPFAFSPGQATGPEHYLVNVAALSMCDYVATVPSTSGVFPAFFGNIPVIPIYGQNFDIKAAPILKKHLFDCLRDPIMALSIN